MLIETDLYKHDFLKVYEFFDRSDLTRKVNGFTQSIKDATLVGNSRSVLFTIKEFIRVLSLKPEDGKFIITKN